MPNLTDGGHEERNGEGGGVPQPPTSDQHEAMRTVRRAIAIAAVKATADAKAALDRTAR